MGEIRVVSDGTKEGTAVFVDGVKMTTDHWELLTWQFDFLREEWTVRVEHLPLPGRPNLPAIRRLADGDPIHVDLTLGAKDQESRRQRGGGETIQATGTRYCPFCRGVETVKITMEDIESGKIRRTTAECRGCGRTLYTEVFPKKEITVEER